MRGSSEVELASEFDADDVHGLQALEPKAQVLAGSPKRHLTGPFHPASARLPADLATNEIGVPEGESKPISSIAAGAVKLSHSPRTGPSILARFPNGGRNSWLCSGFSPIRPSATSPRIFPKKAGLPR